MLKLSIHKFVFLLNGFIPVTNKIIPNIILALALPVFLFVVNNTLYVFLRKIEGLSPL